MLTFQNTNVTLHGYVFMKAHIHGLVIYTFPALSQISAPYFELPQLSELLSCITIAFASLYS